MDHDLERMNRYYTVRVELNEGKIVSAIPIHPEALHPLNVPGLFEQKLALLKIAPVGAVVDGVGKRKAENIYYVRFYQDEPNWSDTHEMPMWR